MELFIIQIIHRHHKLTAGGLVPDGYEVEEFIGDLDDAISHCTDRVLTLDRKEVEMVDLFYKRGMRKRDIDSTLKSHINGNMDHEGLIWDL